MRFNIKLYCRKMIIKYAVYGKASCVECCFRFYAVVSVLNLVSLGEKAMKNPLFRAYYEETAGIEQDWYQKMWLYHFFDTEKIILVSTLVC